jgi:hypothetical protein
MRTVVPRLLVAFALAVAALLAIGGSLSGPSRWSPDGLFYQARVYELRGADHGDAVARAFRGPLGADLRRIDPHRSGNPMWVAYNAQFYARRLTVPLAAAALQPLAGDRALLDVSLAGYLAAVLGLFALLLTRFRLGVAAAVTAATVFVPALVLNASYPLTDSWGLALEIGALVSAILAVERGPRWLAGWVVAIALLSFTRDSVWIPILAALWLTLMLRSRIAIALFSSGCAAALPAAISVSYPMRELLAQMLNGLQPPADPSWGFIAGHWPGAVAEMLRADGGFVRNGAWYTAAYLLAGLACLFLLGRRGNRAPATTLLQAAAVASAAYVLTVPVFSGFRLELACLPMAAYGLAFGLERLVETYAVGRAAPSRRSGLLRRKPVADLVSERP